MKNRFDFWLGTGIVAGLAAGVVMKNTSAGIALGIITGFLLALLQTNYAKK